MITDSINDLARSFDIYSAAFAGRRYEIYDLVRNEGPLWRATSHGGFWAATSYRAIKEIAQNTDLFSSSQGILLDGLIPEQYASRIGDFRSYPIECDPPESTEIRTAMAPLFDEARAKRLTDDFRSLIRELLRQFRRRGGGDFILTVAQPVAGMSVMDFVGLDRSDWRDFVLPILNFETGAVSPFRAVQGIRTLTDRLQAVKAGCPMNRDPAMRLLAAALSENDAVPPDAIVPVLNMLIGAGSDSLNAIIGRIVQHLAENPEIQAHIRDRPECIPNAISEYLRLYTPTQAVCRTATRTMDFQGVTIREADKILMCWAAGNRDPARFSYPNDFRIDRKYKNILSFGAGSHFCPGANLSKRFLSITIEELFCEIPSFQLIRTARDAPNLGMLNALTSLPITWNKDKATCTTR